MKAVARICFLIFATTPFFRAIGMIGLILFIGGHLMAGLGYRVFGLFATLGLVLVLIVPAFLGGALLRMLAAPRSTRFIPYYRARLMLGSALALIIGCSLVVLHMGLIGTERPGESTHALLAFSLSLALSSSIWIGMFLITSTPYAAFGPAILLLVKSYLPDSFGATMFQPSTLLVFTALVWSGFAIWYCRVRRISAIDFANNPRFMMRPPGAKAKTLQSPSGMLLNPNAESMRRWQKLAPLLFLGLFLLSIKTATEGASPLIFLLSFGVVAGTVTPFMSAWIVCRRAKFLWLRSAGRPDAFRISEAVAWRHVLPNVATLAFCVAMVPWFMPGQGRRALAMVGSVLAVLPCWLYLGIAWTRSLNAADLVLAIAVSAYSLATIVIGWRHQPSLTFIFLLAGALALAVVLRRLAQGRWSTIDWLDAKPPKTMSGLWRQTT